MTGPSVVIAAQSELCWRNIAIALTIPVYESEDKLSELVRLLTEQNSNRHHLFTGNAFHTGVQRF